MDRSLRFGLLDPMRGLAALWVLLFHYSDFTELFKAWPYVEDLVRTGDRGVPMFFVISGYCLARTCRHALAKDESAARFLGRRAWRIYSTFWCSLALSLLLIVVHYSIFFKKLHVPLSWWEPRLGVYSAWDWLNVVALTRIFDESAGMFFVRFGGINGACWSLAIEMQFYVAVALALWMRRGTIPILVAITLASIVPLCREDWYFSIAQTGIFLPHWFHFALGMALFVLFEKGITPARVFGRFAPWAAAVAWAGLIGVILVRNRTIFGTEFALEFSAFLWFGLEIERVFTASKMSRTAIAERLGAFLLLLGEMSYSLYLTHLGLAWILLKLARYVGLPELAAFLMVVPATLAGAYLFFRVCEAPFRKDLNPFERRRAAKADSVAMGGATMKQAA